MENKSKGEKGGDKAKVKMVYYTEDDIKKVVQDCALCALRDTLWEFANLDEISESSALAFTLYARGVLSLEERVVDAFPSENAEGESDG